MSTTETFSNWVMLYKGTNNVYSLYNGSSYTVNDSADGNDGQTAVGNNVYVVEFNSSYTLLGTTANGVVVSGPLYDYLFTNATYSNGDSVSINTTDPYNYLNRAGKFGGGFV
jgi:hypothetical protein